MKIEAAILEGRLFVFFVLVSNHYFTIVLFFGALQLTTHTSIKAAKVVTLKPFPSSTNFDPDLRLPRINCFTICFYKLHFACSSPTHKKQQHTRMS